MISLALHILLIVFAVSNVTPVPQPEQDKVVINSYLTFKPRPIKKPEPKPVAAITETEPPQPAIKVTEAAIAGAPISDEVAIDKEVVSQKSSQQPTTTAITEATQAPTELPSAYFDRPTNSILDKSTKFISEVNDLALDALSAEALNDYLTPKPIVDNSRKSPTERIQEEVNDSFAPKGANITVLQQLAGETLILQGDACYRVQETALDDKIYRGRSVWLGSSGCKRPDKFNGQLQISLDKYLKKGN